jgi:TRAP-type C4-dicarboxylate transport system substrate-binding protein
MKFKFKKPSGGTLIALATTVFFANATVAAEQVLKMSFFGPAKDPTYADVLEPWMNAINEDGKGILRIDAFPGGALVKGAAGQAKAVMDGVVDMAWVVPAYTPGRFPDNDVMELSGIFDNVKETSIVFRRLYDRGLLSGYEDFYVPLLSTTHPYAIHTKDPVKSMDDIKGLKLRAGGPVASAAIKALGGVPVGMPIPGVAENISKGVLDGTGSEWNVMYSFKIIEVAKNHYMQRLGTVPLSVLMNKTSFEGLTPEAQAIIEKHSGEALSRKFGDVHFAIQGDKLAKTKAMSGHTIVMPTDDEIVRWAALMKTVNEEWVSSHPKGKVLFDAAMEELAKVRAE